MGKTKRRTNSAGDPSGPRTKVSCLTNISGCGPKSPSSPSSMATNSIDIDEMVDIINNVASQSQSSTQAAEGQNGQTGHDAQDVRDEQPNDANEIIRKQKTTINKLAGQVNDQRNKIVLLQKTVAELNSTVENQRLLMDTLTTKIQFVLSFLNIDQNTSLTNAVSPSTNTSPTTYKGTDGKQSSQRTSYAAVASQQHMSTQEQVVAAVYLDQSQRDRRANNIVITGLPVCPDMSDKALVSQMISKELLIVPDIVQLRRLGRTGNDINLNAGLNVQPLLVVLKTTSQANSILQRAKLLRGSVHSVISDHVYINRHLTRAESIAAYEERRQRRDRAVRRQAESTSSSSAVSKAAPTPAAPVVDSTAGPMPHSGVAAGLNTLAAPFTCKSFTDAVCAASPFDDLINFTN